ncbi:hypothetical protein JTB14_004528 [Gonioctena quinquepunctata]|nr:hypothetical protein JTB14_004528 [Gonioctena quinquepunctata]
MGKAIKVLREEIIKNKREIKFAIGASESKLLLKIEELNHRVVNLEIENNKIEALKITTEKNNIIIFGLEDSEEVSPSTVCKDIKKLLDVEVHISDLNISYKLRTQGRNLLKVELVSYLKKLEVVKQCRKFKGTSIGISNNLTYKQRCENKILRNYLNKARQNPADNSYMKSNILYINNVAYTVEELVKNENSYLEERKASSAPPTPMTRNFDEVLQLGAQSEKGNIPEEAKEDKKTPSNTGRNKNPPKTTAAPYMSQFENQYPISYIILSETWEIHISLFHMHGNHNIYSPLNESDGIMVYIRDTITSISKQINLGETQAVFTEFDVGAVNIFDSLSPSDLL